MTHRLPPLLASLAAVSLLVCRPGLAAIPGAEIIAAEAAIRQADADWAAAAGSASVDAWMTFYAADAVVMAPDNRIAGDRTAVRRIVSGLLSLPGLSIAWHPSKVEVAASGDLAYLIGAYELQYDDARAGRISDRGKLLEVWKKQSDGSFKCIVDTWNSDGPAAPTHSAPPVGALAGGPAPGSAAAPPAANPSPARPSAAQPPSPDPGEMPAQYEETIRQYFQKYLKNPQSVQYREITKPERGYATTIAGPIFVRERRLWGWTVKATINAENTHGVYVGFKTYTFLFRGETIVHTTSPLAEDEIN